MKAKVSKLLEKLDNIDILLKSHLYSVTQQEVTTTHIPSFLKAMRFLMVAAEPREMSRCLELVRFLSIEIAERSMSAF